jgi:hypothetical protein
VLTNEKGVRTYLYVLNTYEKINFSDFISDYSKSDMDRIAYTPIALCIMSHVSNTDAFKNVLLEVYKIILNDGKDANESESYKNSNLLNFFVFLNNIINPYSYSRMTLNLSKINN